MATTVSDCSWISAVWLLLAAPALAQSQGDTGVGAALDQAQAGIDKVESLFDEQWNGQAGRWVKGGIGVAGLAAALLSAGDAVISETGEGTINVDDGRLRLRFGATAGTVDPGAPGASNAPTGTR